MFTDERWKLIHERIYYGEIDGQKNGVVLATQPPNRDKYAWNCDERERVLNARLTGKIDLAFVVAAKLNGFRKPPEYQCGNFIEAVSTTSLRKIAGRYGDLWLLQLGDIDPDAPL
jgi:hypothetical protein